MNNCSVIGRITHPPEFKTLSSGKKLTEFSIAVNSYNDGAYFFPVKAWERTASVINDHFEKGDRIAITGYLAQERWEKDGKTNSRVVIVCTLVTFIELKKDKENESQYSSDEVPF